MQSIHVQQQQAQQQLRHGTFLDFCCMGDGGDFDEEVLMHGRFLGLVRDDMGTLQVHAEFVFDDAAETGNSDATGTGWWL